MDEVRVLAVHGGLCIRDILRVDAFIQDPSEVAEWQDDHAGFRRCEDARGIRHIGGRLHFSRYSACALWGQFAADRGVAYRFEHHPDVHGVLFQVVPSADEILVGQGNPELSLNR